MVCESRLAKTSKTHNGYNFELPSKAIIFFQPLDDLLPWTICPNKSLCFDKQCWQSRINLNGLAKITGNFIKLVPHTAIAFFLNTRLEFFNKVSNLVA